MTDSDRWQTWLTEQGPALVLLARQWVSNQSDAEDVVQEAFVRFWKSKHRALDQAAYLYSCLKSSALDWQRAGARRNRREETVSRAEVATLFECPAEESERQAAITVALGELPEEQRTVLVMRIWGGLSFPQIAEALEISPNTAASRYRYALSKLQQTLATESAR